MKKSKIKTQSTSILLLIIGILFTFSCKNENKGTSINNVNPEIEQTTIENDLLVGSWKDNSEAALDFTLLKDGSARSDNMKTLLYKKWSVNGDQITFIIESIGNGTSSTDTETYTIEKLNKDQLIIKKGDYQSEYTKK